MFATHRQMRCLLGGSSKTGARSLKRSAMILAIYVEVRSITTFYAVTMPIAVVVPARTP